MWVRCLSANRENYAEVGSTVLGRTNNFRKLHFNIISKFIPKSLYYKIEFLSLKNLNNCWYPFIFNKPRQFGDEASSIHSRGFSYSLTMDEMQEKVKLKSCLFCGCLCTECCIKFFVSIMQMGIFLEHDLWTPAPPLA